MDLRRRVVDAWDNGEGTLKELADRFCIGRTTLCDILRRERQTGSIAPSEVRGHPPRAVDEAGRELIRQLVVGSPDATIPELTAAYNARAARPVSTATLGREVRAMKLTRKKRHSRPPSKTVPTSKKPERPLPSR